jgi:hypothetical protein
MLLRKLVLVMITKSFCLNTTAYAQESYSRKKLKDLFERELIYIC